MLAMQALSFSFYVIFMLTFSEEIMLMALDEESGLVLPLPERSLDFALAGALLLELVQHKKISTDCKNIKVISREKISDKLLAEVMNLIPDEEVLPLKKVLNIIALKGARWKAKALTSLVKKKIVRRKRLSIFWFIKRKVYPIKDPSCMDDMRRRIRKIVTSLDQEPSFNDIVIISLMNACSLGSVFFNGDELDLYRMRIEKISKMDPIAEAISQSIKEIQTAIMEVVSVSRL